MTPSLSVISVGSLALGTRVHYLPPESEASNGD